MAWATDGTARRSLWPASSSPGRDVLANSPSSSLRALSVTTSMTAAGSWSLARYQALSSAPLDISSSGAAARPSWMPRWRLARRSRVCDAGREGVGRVGTGVAPTLPGTKFAFGTRVGSPATVIPPDTGAFATCAARQPSSAGDVQSSARVSAGAEPAVPCPRRRNQSDSTDWKIGGWFSCPALTAGGTIMPCRTGPDWLPNDGIAGLSERSADPGPVPTVAAAPLSGPPGAGSASASCAEEETGPASCVAASSVPVSGASSSPLLVSASGAADTSGEAAAPVSGPITENAAVSSS